MSTWIVSEPGGGGSAEVAADSRADAIEAYRREAEREYGPGGGWHGVRLIVRPLGGGETTTHDALTGDEVTPTIMWRVEAVWGTTGDCSPEQIYGHSEPPGYDTERDARAAVGELLPGAREVAPAVRFVVYRTEGIR